MVKSLCHLLMKVNHVIVANFYIANMSFNAIHENKIQAKISEFTVFVFKKTKSGSTAKPRIFEFRFFEILANSK